VNDKEWVRSRW